MYFLLFCALSDLLLFCPIQPHAADRKCDCFADLAWRITPCAYERGQRSFNETLSFGQYFWNPLITWWRLFIWPISLLLSWIFHS